ncbi:hypothetical protein L6R50_25010 [Myxococcota bacterium]|nr:hypothetical protein [Myxococcota bacterium]
MRAREHDPLAQLRDGLQTLGILGTFWLPFALIWPLMRAEAATTAVVTGLGILCAWNMKAERRAVPLAVAALVHGGLLLWLVTEVEPGGWTVLAGLLESALVLAATTTWRMGERDR